MINVKIKAHPPLSVARARQKLRAVANPPRAERLRRFFKTGPGEYGEHDRFLGLTVPVVRRIARECRGWTLTQTRHLLRSPWHEERLLALIVLVDRCRRSGPAGRSDIVRFYLGASRYVNNWDLVDVSAPTILGPRIAAGDTRLVNRLARSTAVWERRMAVLGSFYAIRQGEVGQAVRVAEMMLRDEHDLIHKAAGWMLREVGKRDEPALRAFLDRHAARMPRTMLRYAIERLPAGVRTHYRKTEGRV
jgi:3-methyladenine DNA glycosylase AlkD